MNGFRSLYLIARHTWTEVVLSRVYDFWIAGGGSDRCFDLSHKFSFRIRRDPVHQRFGAGGHLAFRVHPRSDLGGAALLSRNRAENCPAHSGASGDAVTVPSREILRDSGPHTLVRIGDVNPREYSPVVA